MNFDAISYFHYMNKVLIFYLLVQLCHDLEPQLRKEIQRSHAIPVPVMVLSTLGFLATRTIQREIGDRSGISQPTFSRTMSAVLAAMK